ncbi:hypothetical protein [uncultured Amaricoccus sp.]|uniref:hypothetical protein n=1 Tax=uncultured Amaricoccus sp. TaxID=339341 RepID=UPI002633198C|nr:hypothetical protein [uncultured Amaricoccus sp.]
MFDFTPDLSCSQETASPRILALELIAHSSARLRLAASRLGGEAGTALVCALRDMVIDTTVDPLHWPIEETIALLRRPGPGRDAQVDRLVTQLEWIRKRIGSEPDARAA